MLLVVAVVLSLLVVGAIAGAMVHAARQAPVAEPSPRPKRDDKVAVLEGGSGRGWD